MVKMVKKKIWVLRRQWKIVPFFTDEEGRVRAITSEEEQLRSLRRGRRNLGKITREGFLRCAKEKTSKGKRVSIPFHLNFEMHHEGPAFRPLKTEEES